MVSEKPTEVIPGGSGFLGRRPLVLPAHQGNALIP